MYEPSGTNATVCGLGQTLVKHDRRSWRHGTYRYGQMSKEHRAITAVPQRKRPT